MPHDAGRKYFPKLTGKRCYLSPISAEDAEQYCEWLNDLEVTSNLTMATGVVSLSSEKQFLENLSKQHAYAIVDRATDRLIGNCGLIDVNHVDRTCEIGIFIGDKEHDVIFMDILDEEFRAAQGDT